jgi:hypothetical protein
MGPVTFRIITTVDRRASAPNRLKGLKTDA